MRIREFRPLKAAVKVVEGAGILTMSFAILFMCIAHQARYTRKE